MDTTLFNMRTNVINARHPSVAPKGARAMPDKTYERIFDAGFQRFYGGLTRSGAEFLRKLYTAGPIWGAHSPALKLDY